MTRRAHLQRPAAHRAITTHRAEVLDDHHFTPHAHEAHELLWGTTGLFTVTCGERLWVVTAAIGVLVPAGVRHGGFGAQGSTFYQTHLDPLDVRVAGDRPVAVVVTPALRELLLHLQSSAIGVAARRRAEAVVVDLLRPMGVSTIELPIPTDERARRVADAVLADPADCRTLAMWGRVVGASERTLSRLFADEVQMSFSQWRAYARVSAAIGLLAGGETVSAVSHRVGYSSPSAFIRAFRDVTGETPGTYLAGQARSGLEIADTVYYEDAAHAREGALIWASSPAGPRRSRIRPAIGVAGPAHTMAG